MSRNPALCDSPARHAARCVHMGALVVHLCTRHAMCSRIKSMTAADITRAQRFDDRIRHDADVREGGAAAWCANDVDWFIIAKLESGLQPALRADRNTLSR